jgi:hypothetical protein
MRLEHLHGLNVDMAVGDHACSWRSMVSWSEKDNRCIS